MKSTSNLIIKLKQLWRHWRRPIKRAIDIVGSIVALILLSPLMLLIALVIKIESPGPVIYGQERVGRKGRIFTIYKFRSMVTDAEKDGPKWSQGVKDQRITRIGHFLRKTHLDELPQFWNVLKGEMSIVGPRPERPFFTEEFQKVIPGYEERHKVKPGITGLAQTRYRYDASIADVKRKLRFDKLYIQRMGLRLDLRILVRTILVMLRRKGQ